MPVSIREVASRVGVSAGTVSHVLNGNAAARIAPQTQERIRAAAAEMGYRPNRLARSLGRRRTDTVGLLISGLRNPYFVEILESAEAFALEAGYQVLLDAAPTFNGTFRDHMKLASWPVDGVLMWGTDFQNLGQFLGSQADDLPVVYMGYERTDDADWVAFDYAGGARLAMEYLVGRGYRRIGAVVPYPFGAGWHDEARNRAYRAVCAEAGLTPRLFVTNADESRTAGLKAGEEIAALPVGERPDALFCHNDLLAIGVYCGLRRAGLRVPEDIAVVGFDGIEEGKFLERPLTTVRIPSERLCQKSFEILARRLAGERESARQLVIPASLIQGGTA